MTRYTMFNPDADPNEQNIAWKCSSKSEALRNLPSSGWYIIRGDYFKGKSDMWRENQVDAVRFIKRVISGELGGKQYYLDGVEWKCPRSNWDDESDEDDLTEDVRKMSFNDMVKKQRGKAVKKEFLADLDKYDDIGYMAEACANEMDSVFNAINTTPTTDLEFKCSSDEYYQKLLECKKNIDWLVENISVWIR